MDSNLNGRREFLKSRDMRRQKDDSDGEEEVDSPVLNFVYDDCDSHINEIAELYSYTEYPEFALNEKAFEELMKEFELPQSWQKLTKIQQRSAIMRLLDRLECTNKVQRMKAARCILYIAQGCWAEMQSDAEQQHWTRVNVMLLYQMGTFSAIVDVLNYVIDDNDAALEAMQKVSVSLNESTDLRIILSILYIITEVMRAEKDEVNSEYSSVVESFREELGTPYGDELLVVKLLDMVTFFCSGGYPHYPMKKVLLLLWKVLLVYLGGSSTLKELKNKYRMRYDLPPMTEDTVEITRNMRPSSPPPSANDLIDAQNQKRRPFRRQFIIKQTSLDESDREQMFMERDEMGIVNDNDSDEEMEDNNAFDASGNNNSRREAAPMLPAWPEVTLEEQAATPEPCPTPRGLPWLPKVRQKDIDTFLDNARIKFVGYSLPGDSVTLAGLPQPIHEGISILHRHMYVSLAEMQLKRESEIARSPLTKAEGEVEETPAEILYRAILPSLTQYTIALLKILLAAAPTSNGKTDSINIMADVLPEGNPMTVLQSMKLGIDVNRHKEIITKAISGILLLLLKHFKLNHAYQFEFMSQLLVFANCIPLVLKFFNQNITSYVAAKNVIPIIEFPACVIGEQAELTQDSLEIGDTSFQYSWRNLYSCINLLRTLNKLIKWKHSRIMLLVVFKSAPILKRTLKVRHAMMQVYVLKLLKMQTKYLGRQWRKSNMKTISAIYAKVRHRLNDDWAFGNDVEARPWDFQGEECALRNQIDRFNKRRYAKPVPDGLSSPCLASVLSIPVLLGEDFKKHYELWLEQEVYNSTVNWDILLEH